MFDILFDKLYRSWLLKWTQSQLFKAGRLLSFLITQTKWLSAQFHPIWAVKLSLSSLNIIKHQCTGGTLTYLIARDAHLSNSEDFSPLDSLTRASPTIVNRKIFLPPLLIESPRLLFILVCPSLPVFIFHANFPPLTSLSKPLRLLSICAE